MKPNQYKTLFAAFALILGCASISRAADAPTLASPYVFTDEKAVVTVPQSTTPIAYSLKTIMRDGWGQTKAGQSTPIAGRIEIAPLVEGIHILELQTQPPQSVRFLAMKPPVRVDAKAWRRTLPRVGAKLVSGAPFKILAMGDSVTWSGDYESLLVKMLQRATGNRNISFVDKSYPGRSVDASVREWINDGPPNRPDLGLLMYGLNDQITNVPLDAYLEQYEWIARRLHEINADCVFLQPTPDIGIPLNEADRKPDSNAPSYILRTLGFGEALRPLAQKLNVPLAETFSALWGNGGATLEESARRMWPVFPTGYSNQFHSLIESDGKGDTIHPNVLGHLQIARAVFASLAGERSTPVWQWKTQTEWTPRGAVSTLTARNVSGVRRIGRLEVQPPTDAMLEAAPVAYDLAPGQTKQFSVLWQQAKKPVDLLSYPANRYLSHGQPMITVVDFHNNQSHVYAATAAFESQAAFVREREIVTNNKFAATYFADGKSFQLPVTIPVNSAVGRVPLVQKVGQNGWAVGELAYVRYGAARSGEATVDGKLEEWQNALWIPLGEPSQARSWRGPEDNRAHPQEFDLSAAFKAGSDGIYLAARATGNVEKDSFTLFFDPREPKLLGTAGRYFWIGGSFKPDGFIELSKGETSKEAPGLKGAWQKTATGVTLEIFVPYAAMDAKAWPASGDLGVSPIWVHTDAADKRTNLMWSENGHWWNPRWYGVVRRTDEANPQLPYMVRVN